MKPVEKKHVPKVKKAISKSSPNFKPEEALSASTPKLKTTSNSVVQEDLQKSYENCGKLQVYSLVFFFNVIVSTHSFHKVLWYVNMDILI